ncbi:MAG TPA: hypothetical protein VK554_00655 [Bradyrhizobium sp.]|nr:hypothetical protein [Bradyrhizobium sp.]
MVPRSRQMPNARAYRAFGDTLLDEKPISSNRSNIFRVVSCNRTGALIAPMVGVPRRYHSALIRGTNIALRNLPENTGARWMKLIILFLSIFGCFIAGVNARDLGQWEAVDPAIREWYQALMQPDVPTASCCGEADAYWADEVHVRDGKTYVKITDDRPDEPRGRPHVEIGTEIEIPNHKLKWDRANPTGHGIVFLSRNGYVFCYVQPGGV